MADNVEVLVRVRVFEKMEVLIVWLEKAIGGVRCAKGPEL